MLLLNHHAFCWTMGLRTFFKNASQNPGTNELPHQNILINLLSSTLPAVGAYSLVPEIIPDQQKLESLISIVNLAQRERRRRFDCGLTSENRRNTSTAFHHLI